MAWCHEPLSQTHREYRADVLAKAFGLQSHYMRRYCLDRENIVSMGSHLAREIIGFIIDHPDISPNQPTDDKHWFADIDTSGG